MKFCGECGNKLKNDEQFCSECGTPVENISNSHEEAETEDIPLVDEKDSSVNSEGKFPEKTENETLNTVDKNSAKNEESQFSESVKTKKSISINKNVTYGIGAVAVALAIGIGGYFGVSYFKSKDKASSEPTTSATPTSSSTATPTSTPTSTEKSSTDDIAATNGLLKKVSGSSNVYEGGGTYTSSSGYTVTVPKGTYLMVNTPDDLAFLNSPDSAASAKYELKLEPDANAVNDTFDLDTKCDMGTKKPYGTADFQTLDNFGNPRNSPLNNTAGTPDLSPRALVRYFEEPFGQDDWGTEMVITDHAMGNGGEYCTSDFTNSAGFVRTSIGKMTFEATSNGSSSLKSEDSAKQTAANQVNSDLYKQFVEIAKTIKITK
ncbi:MAG: zinc ribbon domain-containing protein [Micrococcaceae bacterium]